MEVRLLPPQPLNLRKEGIVTQFQDPGAGAAASSVLRRAPRLHHLKLRQHGLPRRPCWLLNAGKRLSVKTARKGALHEKSSSPVRAAFFMVLTGEVFLCYIAQRYRL